MKGFVVGIVAAAGLVSLAGTAMAQVKTFDVVMKTETATVESIEAASRTVTLKKPDGSFVTVVAGPDIKRFAEIKVGDKVNARYYENVVMRLKRAGEPDVDTATKATTPAEAVLPGGTKAKQRTITAVISEHRHEHAVDHLHRTEQLEIHVHRAGQGESRQSQGRRQGRHHVDRSGAGVARARQVSSRGRDFFPQVSTRRGQISVTRSVPYLWKPVEKSPVPLSCDHS